MSEGQKIIEDTVHKLMKDDRHRALHIGTLGNGEGEMIKIIDMNAYRHYGRDTCLFKTRVEGNPEEVRRQVQMEVKQLQEEYGSKITSDYD